MADSTSGLFKLTEKGRIKEYRQDLTDDMLRNSVNAFYLDNKIKKALQMLMLFWFCLYEALPAKEKKYVDGKETDELTERMYSALKNPDVTAEEFLEIWHVTMNKVNRHTKYFIDFERKAVEKQ